MGLLKLEKLIVVERDVLVLIVNVVERVLTHSFSTYQGQLYVLVAYWLQWVVARGLPFPC